MNVPHGWKLVPVEPTEEMVIAAEREVETHDFLRLDHAYRAALDAAPAPQVQQDDPLTRLIRTSEALGAYRQPQQDEALEVARLREALTAANAQAEHFEREWYLRGDEVERLRAFERGVIEAIPGPRYMDPPDGGDVTPLEQVRRMAAEVERLLSANQDLQGWLYRSGFVPCDIAACNCGGWHARFGLPERMEELKTLLSDAGHPLTNENGNLPRQALADLIGERDTLRGDLAEASKDAARYRWVRGDSCMDHSVRWTQWEVRRWNAPIWTNDLRRADLDAAIDEAMRKEPDHAR